MTLDVIAETIGDTAVDVFVYDTSKDSDGGAWRKRTQGTSWYNETLNTATRGSRKEFPAVAVIVAESNQVTIYDGDDPDLPMWMVFNAGTRHSIGSATITSSNCIKWMLLLARSGNKGLSMRLFMTIADTSILSATACNVCQLRYRTKFRALQRATLPAGIVGGLWTVQRRSHDRATQRPY